MIGGPGFKSRCRPTKGWSPSIPTPPPGRHDAPRPPERGHDWDVVRSKPSPREDHQKHFGPVTMVAAFANFFPYSCLLFLRGVKSCLFRRPLNKVCSCLGYSLVKCSCLGYSLVKCSCSNKYFVIWGKQYIAALLRLKWLPCFSDYIFFNVQYALGEHIYRT